MHRKLRVRRPSAAMVVACLALFVALGGASIAALKLKPNSVKAKNIKTAAVTEPKIATGAVTEPKIATGAVTEPKIATGAVTESKIGTAAVSTGKIADGAVTGPKLGANSVDASKIANGVIGKTKLTAAGSSSNGGSYSLVTNACTDDTTFLATGLQVGDVVAFSLRVAPSVGGVLSASAGGNTVSGTGTFNIEICNYGTTATITPGSLTLNWIAVR